MTFERFGYWLKTSLSVITHWELCIKSGVIFRINLMITLPILKPMAIARCTQRSLQRTSHLKCKSVPRICIMKQSLGYVRTSIIKKAQKIPITLLTIVYIPCVQYLSIIKNVMMPAHINQRMIPKVSNKFKISKVLKRFMYLAVMGTLKSYRAVQPF